MTRVRLATIAAALAVAWLLKHHYSQASAEALRWILAPTAWLSWLVLGGDFQLLPDQGYLSREHSILISPACAGVNFLIVAFLSLVLGFGSHFKTPGRALAWASGAILWALGAKPAPMGDSFEVERPPAPGVDDPQC